MTSAVSSGIAEDKTVLVTAERAVGNCAVIGVVAAGEELVLVHLIGLGSVAVVVMTGKSNVVYPEVLTGAEIAYDRVIVVGLCIVLHIEVFDDNIVARCGMALGAELNVEEGMSTIASYDGLIALHIYSSGSTHIACFVEAELGNADILGDEDSIGCRRLSVFFQLVEGRSLNDLTEQTADVTGFDAAGVVVIAVACKAL